jgi:hypothetical protein
MNPVHNLGLIRLILLAVLRAPEVRDRSKNQKRFRGVPALGSGTNYRRTVNPPLSFTQNQPIGNAPRAPALLG